MIINLDAVNAVIRKNFEHVVQIQGKYNEKPMEIDANLLEVVRMQKIYH
jgi:hypothetical protein